MNTYQCSNGDRVTQGQIDYRERLGKFALLEKQRMDIGYNVCTICLRNDCKPVDCSHNISKKKAKEMGKTELIWDYENNMEIIGRDHHKEKDGLNLQFSE